MNLFGDMYGTQHDGKRWFSHAVGHGDLWQQFRAVHWFLADDWTIHHAGLHCFLKAPTLMPIHVLVPVRAETPQTVLFQFMFHCRCKFTDHVNDFKKQINRLGHSNKQTNTHTLISTTPPHHHKQTTLTCAHHHATSTQRTSHPLVPTQTHRRLGQSSKSFFLARHWHNVVPASSWHSPIP